MPIHHFTDEETKAQSSDLLKVTERERASKSNTYTERANVQD